MSQEFQVHRFSNGLTLLGEQMDSVSSAAFSLLVPIGAASDPENSEGATTVLTEMFHKGAGPWNSMQLSEQFEEIGVSHNHSAGTEVSMFSCAGLPEHLPHSLKLHGTLLLEPRLPEDELESVRQLALQDLNSLEDEPSSKVMVELTRQYYPAPFNRSHMGTKNGLLGLSVEKLRKYYASDFKPERAILGVAGKFNWREIIKTTEESFGRWTGSSKPLQVQPFVGGNKRTHLDQDTAQLQIALAYPSVAYDHPDYYVARVAINVLSGGMSGRLFIEVREKRGLVYHVSASHSATKGRAAIFAYAGTTPENGEKTLEVMLAELRRMREGVSPEELHRAKIDLKARTLMQNELSSVRASSLVNDQWNLGRPRTAQEIKAAIDSVTNEDICRHLSEFPVQNVTLVTLGKKSLELPL